VPDKWDIVAPETPVMVKTLVMFSVNEMIVPHAIPPDGAVNCQWSSPFPFHVVAEFIPSSVKLMEAFPELNLM